MERNDDIWELENRRLANNVHNKKTYDNNIIRAYKNKKKRKGTGYKYKEDVSNIIKWLYSNNERGITDIGVVHITEALQYLGNQKIGLDAEAALSEAIKIITKYLNGKISAIDANDSLLHLVKRIRSNRNIGIALIKDSYINSTTGVIGATSAFIYAAHWYNLCQVLEALRSQIQVATTTISGKAVILNIMTTVYKNIPDLKMTGPVSYYNLLYNSLTMDSPNIEFVYLRNIENDNYFNQAIVFLADMFDNVSADALSNEEVRFNTITNAIKTELDNLVIIRESTLFFFKVFISVLILIFLIFSAWKVYHIRNYRRLNRRVSSLRLKDENDDDTVTVESYPRLHFGYNKSKSRRRRSHKLHKSKSRRRRNI
jgi:hypothetical protein